MTSSLPDPNTERAPEPDSTAPASAVRKFTFQVRAGKTRYTVVHWLGTKDVVVQTRIAGRIREGGISVIDENTIQLEFGGALNEAIDGVVIG